MSAVTTDRVFAALELHSWRQFERVDLKFHERLTVITGANAAGKTTLLNLLSQHFGWPSQFVATPGKRQDGLLQYLVGWHGLGGDVREAPAPGQKVAGLLRYSDGASTDVLLPEDSSSALFNLQFRQIQSVQGLYLTSHRPVSAYQPVPQVPTAIPQREQLLEQHVGEHRARYQGSHTGSTPVLRLKEALIGLAVFGFGSEVVEPNPAAAELYTGFEEVLRRVLPPVLGFDRIKIEPPEVVLETETGRFPLDAMSGGTQAIVDLAWQIYLRSRQDGAFVVLIDEPENHLHPELQRSLLPGLLDAFRGAQFIVTTHNPFVVTSVPDSRIYALTFSEEEEGIERRVVSVPLDDINKAGTSNEILRDVLGLETPMPLWVEQRLTELVERHAHAAGPEGLESLRTELLAMGMHHRLPEAIEQALEARE